MKRFYSLILLLAMVLTLSACNYGTDMPFNGTITFHEMGITIPTDYIRDSTQSSQQMWIFEMGNYKQYIILSANAFDENGTSFVQEYLDSYVEYMLEEGCESELTTFRNYDAVHSTYTKDGMFCQEMLVAWNGTFYAIALRGGTQEEFQALLETVNFTDLLKS